MGDSDIGFYQVSTVVADSTIKAVVDTCDRDDCRLSCRGRGTTLMGMSQWYDRSGRLHVWNENHRETYVCCGKCWRRWKVNQSGDKITGLVELPCED
jgi:hypothetical protein